MPTLVNQTFDEIAQVDTACAQRVLQAGELRAGAVAGIVTTNLTGVVGSASAGTRCPGARSQHPEP